MTVSSDFAPSSLSPLMSSHPAHRVCLHQFQYMGKRYIVQVLWGVSVACCIILYYLDPKVWELSSVVMGSWNSHKQQ